MAQDPNETAGHVEVRAQLSPRLAGEMALPPAVRKAAGTVVTFTTVGSKLLDKGRQLFRVHAVIDNARYPIGSGAIGQILSGRSADVEEMSGSDAAEAFMANLSAAHDCNAPPTKVMIAAHRTAVSRYARVLANAPSREVALR